MTKNLKPPFSLRPLTLAMVAAAFMSSGATAQQAGVIEEILVTAQFREQSLQSTPLSVTAISGDMLEARGQTRLADITAQAPNVMLQVNPAGGGNSMRAFIRGVGQGDQSPAVDPGVGIYIDDVYFSTVTGSIFDLMDLDRVEILRGPQGTLAGMNSMGGAVRMFSRKPQGEGGYIEASMGSFNRTDVKAAGDFTLLDNVLYARVSGVSRHRDGYITRLDYACVHPDDPEVNSGAIPRTTRPSREAQSTAPSGSISGSEAPSAATQASASRNGSPRHPASRANATSAGLS